MDNVFVSEEERIDECRKATTPDGCSCVNKEDDGVRRFDELLVSYSSVDAAARAAIDRRKCIVSIFTDFYSSGFVQHDDDENGPKK